MSKERRLSKFSNPAYSIINCYEAVLVDVMVPKIGEIVSRGTWDPLLWGLNVGVVQSVVIVMRGEYE
jgi:hypothetical protein